MMVKESVGNIGDDDSQTILSEQEFDDVSVNDALHGNPHSPFYSARATIF